MNVSKTDSLVSKIASNASMLALALMLSFVEALIPIALIPIPGAKLGLANIVTVYVCIRGGAHSRGIADAAMISLGRIAITALLFGSITSFAFSLCGGILVLAALWVLSYSKKLSFVGISVICALFHNIGQLAAATVFAGVAVLSYSPILIAAAALFGAVNGIILNKLSLYVSEKNQNH